MPLIKSQNFLSRASDFFFNQEARLSNTDASGLRRKLGVKLVSSKENPNTMVVDKLTYTQRIESMFRDRQGNYSMPHGAAVVLPSAYMMS